ncbi:SMI1/KNR4 family protein [Carboxylicivirga marina]|uniref:SMI1/KNR4 family protein n=1 Tax=Carboxylicivirga marina TaxID=2800988 RepID=UPI002593899A|nr:SMI1/KNR4 family protein [uncultured Carboxylicivirga sp.]
MIEIIDSNRFGKLSKNDLTDFEAKLSISLPSDYRDFLIENNGGCPKPSTNKIPETDVQCIYGIHEGDYWANLIEHIDMFKERIPSNTIPIANDSGGNLFLLSLRQDSKGEVWFWDHEEEAEESGHEYFENITKAADSFNNFIDNLYEWIDPNEDITEKILRTNDIENLKTLISSGFNIDSKDEYNRSMIEKASIKNRFEIVRLLVDNGAKLNDSLKYAEQNHREFPTYGYEVLIDYLKSIDNKPKWKFWKK